MKTRTTIYLTAPAQGSRAWPTTIGPKGLWRCERREERAGYVRAVYSADNEELDPAYLEGAQAFANRPADWIEPGTPEEELESQEPQPTLNVQPSNYSAEDAHRLGLLRKQHGIKL